MDITQLLAFTMERGASDCHLSAGEPPMIRINGDRSLKGYCYENRKVFCVMYFQTKVPC